MSTEEDSRDFREERGPVVTSLEDLRELGYRGSGGGIIRGFVAGVVFRCSREFGDDEAGGSGGGGMLYI